MHNISFQFHCRYRSTDPSEMYKVSLTFVTLLDTQTCKPAPISISASTCTQTSSEIPTSIPSLTFGLALAPMTGKRADQAQSACE